MHLLRSGGMRPRALMCFIAIVALSCAVERAGAVQRATPSRQPAAVDTLAAFADSSAARDSTAALVSTDSTTAVDPASAPLDSVAGPTPPSAAADSDSNATAAVPALEAVPDPTRPILERDDLDWIEAETLEDVLEAVPGVVVRVEGDTGMPAHVGLDPLANPAPEIWQDGIPTRSPGDLDPGVWDRSAIGVERVGDRRDERLGPVLGPGLWLASRDPEPGKMIVRGRFTDTAFDTSHRALSAITPGSGRSLRVEFEEWKTEEGYAYSGAPGVLGSSVAGRSKMRRFRVGADVATEAGRMRFFFGRGRRFHRGSVLSANSRERWTGELSLAYDGIGRAQGVQARVWHLDWADVDDIVGQEIDASRSGATLTRFGGGDRGLDLRLTAERWSIRHRLELGDTTLVRPAPAGVVEAAATLRLAKVAGSWQPFVGARSTYATHVEDRLGHGFSAGLRRSSRRQTWSLRADRVLRVPTLAETHGVFARQIVTPVDGAFTYADRTLTYQGKSGLGHEKQDRLALTWDLHDDRWRLRATAEHLRLRDGIGWTLADTDLATFVSGAEFDVQQFTGSVRRDFRPGTWRLRVWLDGHRVVGDVDDEVGRGSGYPRWSARSRLAVQRRFFSRHNLIGIEFRARGLGPHSDDVVAPLDDLELPSRWTYDARLTLRIRDAVMSVGYDNLTDERSGDVLGIFDRPRQRRWRLDWTIYN